MAFKDSLRAFMNKQEEDYSYYSEMVRGKSTEQLSREISQGSLGRQKATIEELKRRGYKGK